MSEHIEQRELIKWFRRTYDGVLIFAIPNGGRRDKREAMRLKLEGVTPGVPDLCVPEWRLYIEMKKDKKGRLSKDQKEMISYLIDCGYQVIVGYGFEDAKKQIQEMKA